MSPVTRALAVSAREELRKPLTKVRVQPQEQTDGVTNDLPSPIHTQGTANQQGEEMRSFLTGRVSLAPARREAGRDYSRQARTTARLGPFTSVGRCVVFNLK